jgi:hypothetical protein
MSVIVLIQAESARPAHAFASSSSIHPIQSVHHSKSTRPIGPTDPGDGLPIVHSGTDIQTPHRPTKSTTQHRADPQDNYIQSRSTAIESIESTIAELGQIFTQLAGMVAEQRETVQRIDADTTDIAACVIASSCTGLLLFGSGVNGGE